MLQLLGALEELYGRCCHLDDVLVVAQIAREHCAAGSGKTGVVDLVDFLARLQNLGQN